ncbi:hypothetical protein [Glycomyces paridis]|uniref:Uncharacterized protein n=1 Tax=Glycomyces paridis TaxID=2126555 RepID=A0A4S8P8J8_9ACTN|nr:hypothetical protein [Glycomyces paridis]THV24334.1 hypothetical protein E9998_22195 [Glycomyces paridis]
MRVLPALTSLLLAAALAGCGGDVDDLLRPRPTGCYFGGGEEPVHLTAEQTANAATIAAVGMRDGMDERAVAVAITTAMQESELVNVDYGHHDSLGLFQQRPSMGWGTEEELLDPVYASFKFYEKLDRTDGWRDMTLAEAAQAVQISAYPELYEQWEDDAVVIAAVLAGGEESGLRCVSGSADEAAEPASLAEAYAYQWGIEATSVDETTVVIGPYEAVPGWNRAAWAVARSYDHGIESVAYDGLVWTPGEDGWVEPQSEDGENVAATEDLDPGTIVVTFASEA